MSVERPAASSYRSDADTNQVWDAGWYVYEDGQIIGPLKAQETFDRGRVSESGKPRLVSRKGFSQWYPIEDFASIHQMASRYASELSDMGQQSGAGSHKKSIEPIANQIKTSAQPRRDAALRIATAQQEVMPNVAVSLGDFDFAKQEEPAGPEATRLSRAAKKQLLSVERKAKRLEVKQAKMERRSQNQARQLANVTTKNFEQQYLLVASRLRLGRMKKPVVGGFIYTPLTLGGYWVAWMTDAREEVNWHLNGASRANFTLPQWMCAIPIVHLAFAYSLSRMVSYMERQNGYRTINPWIATALALFPPFYIVLIQGALNRHWRLHVSHSLHEK